MRANSLGSRNSASLNAAILGLHSRSIAWTSLLARLLVKTPHIAWTRSIVSPAVWRGTITVLKLGWVFASRIEWIWVRNSAIAVSNAGGNIAGVTLSQGGV